MTRTGWLLGIALSLAACSRADDRPIDAAVPLDASASGCDTPTALLDLEAQIATGHATCRGWADAVRGRVLVNGFASAVIWSTRTTSEPPLGVMVGAVHVLGPGWFGGEPGTDVAERLAAPSDDELGIMRVRVRTASGAIDRTFVSPQWITYRPAIPAAQHQDVTTILPRHDLFVGLVDGHRAQDDLLAPMPPTFAERSALAIHDPGGLADDERSFVDATPGSLVMLIGYPQAGPEGGAFSIGRVLDDDDARAAIEWLADQGDEEGDIAYEPEVEAIVEGHAVAGMSGGGAFDRDGRLVGVLVRASDPEAERQYVRVVRMRYVASSITRARAALDDAARTAIDGLLPALE
ncbi:trypsin-like peptidase domain-containing protein [Sandaracinus amylolyticus]|uniref:trypsin-like peptidase domain-containing protein n=1 Tax=Sandaracinus amylolyticus TaxID=927083 RepID=UPI001F30133F|nr:trypsin-like peptidase domain-containing protein [Sandaracinus amylolyticus]